MKAVICGAGIAGLTLAWFLERGGWEVLMVERAAVPRDEGYMIDFFASGYDTAELMGLLPRLRELAYHLPEVAYVDRHGNRRSHLDYDLFRRFQRGRLLTLMRGDLEHALRQAAGDRVEIRYDRSVEAVAATADRVTVALTDGTREQADLLVGADGIHSRVRELVFGPERRFLRYLGYHTAAHVFTDDRLSSGLAGSLQLRAAPGRQAGYYPIRGGRVAAFYSHVAADPARPSDPREALRSTYADLGWVVPDALAHCPRPPVLYYDQVAQIEMPAWSRGRVTLAGDACQAVSLLAGQGAAMAMGGAYVLADELSAGTDVAASLTRYEMRVKPAVQRKQAAGRRTAGWVVPNSQWRIAARDQMLRLAGLPGLTWLLRPILTTPAGSIVPRPGPM
jgi:2-polyprenyl-6-methoxyphenol hydroxylase-like FAD-dependent oxidoreductase